MAFVLLVNANGGQLGLRSEIVGLLVLATIFSVGLFLLVVICTFILSLVLER